MLKRVFFPILGGFCYHHRSCATDNHLQCTTMNPSDDCVWSLQSKLFWTLQWAPVPHPREAGWALSHCPWVPHTPKNSLAWENNGTKEQPRHSAPPRESCTKPAGEHTWTLPEFSNLHHISAGNGRGFKVSWGFSLHKNLTIWGVKITGSDLASLFTLWLHYHKKEGFFSSVCVG